MSFGADKLKVGHISPLKSRSIAPLQKNNNKKKQQGSVLHL